MREIGFAPLADRVYCVVFVQQAEAFRVISLRRANSREVNDCDQALQEFRFPVPTSKEDREIAVGIAADADTYAVPSEEIAQMRPRGRPRVAHPKAALTMRVDADVLAALKASGPGAQTRVNDLLKDAVRRGRV